MEPNSYAQVVKDIKWMEAMAVEVASLEANNTWSLTFLPVHKKPIGYKWVCIIKNKIDGSIERYKARLLTKGFTQREDLDTQKPFPQLLKWSLSKLCLLWLL